MKKNKPVRFKETVGIDVGSHSVKIVHLKKASRRLQAVEL